ncbi:MAG: histidinol-phosphate aminotransferase family protein, partial [Alphaproteobacteria bacterium]
MTARRFHAPPPRTPVADPNLTRPDWTGGEPRDPARLWLDKNENADPEMAAVVARVVSEIPPETFRTYPESGPLYR